MKNTDTAINIITILRSTFYTALSSSMPKHGYDGCSFVSTRFDFLYTGETVYKRHARNRT